tara:strand:+ start:724 stop:903 length:180 start_codon:yes stop_codon:yes gene_type:complete
MLEKTITTDSTLQLSKAAVKLTLPAIEIDVYKASASNLNVGIKNELLRIIGEIIDKQLE